MRIFQFCSDLSSKNRMAFGFIKTELRVINKEL